MIVQTTKKLIDVGEIGNASTGDILFDGGEKINEDFNNLYNTFGDQRLFSNDSGIATQTLHATGYYQKYNTIVEWGPPVRMGEQRDVDTTNGPILALLDKGKAGECVVFINSNGSFSAENYFEIQPNNSFVSVPSGNLKIISPFCRITCWCISDDDGISRWDYRIDNMFGEHAIPLDKTYLLNTTKRDIPIAVQSQYQTIKLICTAASTDGRKFKASEILIYNDIASNKLLSTEYAVIRGGNVDEEDEIYTLDFKLDTITTDPTKRYILATASSTTSNIRLAIKVIETQTFGVPL